MDGGQTIVFRNSSVVTSPSDGRITDTTFDDGIQLNITTFADLQQTAVGDANVGLLKNFNHDGLRFRFATEVVLIVVLGHIHSVGVGTGDGDVFSHLRASHTSEFATVHRPMIYGVSIGNCSAVAHRSSQRNIATHAHLVVRE